MASVRAFGMDISDYSGRVDWNKVVLRLQPRFVFARASKITPDLLEYKDKHFAEYRSALEARRIPLGAYHFCQPGYDPAASIKLFFSVYEPKPGDILPTLDIEDSWDSDSSTSLADKLAHIREMVRLVSVRLNGQKPIIYTKARVWADLKNPREFGDCPLWLMDYSEPNDPNYKPVVPPTWREFAFWQSAQNLKVDGIEGNYDSDYFNGSPQKLLKFCIK